MSEELIDASPKIEVNSQSLYQQVEDYRDQVYQLLNDTLEKFHLKGEITKSSPYEYDTWVLIRLWKKDLDGGSSQYRGEATITITALSARTFSIISKVEATSGGRKRKAKNIRDFDEAAAYELIGYIANPKQKFRKKNFKRLGWIFNRNRIIKYPGTKRLALSGMLPAVGMMGFSIHPLLGPITIALSLIPLIMLSRAPQRVVSAGRPPQNPRNLIRMDSWQGVMIDLGSLSAEVKAEVTNELIDGKHEDALIEDEEVSYLGPTGKANRNQLVINFRRAIAFVEIHRYGNDLYVDWEAYLNLGVWKENNVGAGYDKKTRSKIIYTDVSRGLEALNEYDISDANFLIEWVHACLTRVVRRLKKERNIDQEFDFRIQRSDRRSVLQEGEAKAKSGRRAFSRKN